MPSYKEASTFIKQCLLSIALTLCVSSSVVAETVIIEIQKFKFIPETLEIKKGTTVRWVNKEKRQYHSIWFEALGEEEADYFFPDETFERTFDKTGVFPYRCGPHKKMHGSINVVE